MRTIIMLIAGLGQGIMFGRLDASPEQFIVGMVIVVAAFLAGTINL